MQPINYPHIASLIFNAPLIICPTKLETILAALQPRFSGQKIVINPESVAAPMNTKQDRSYLVQNGIAIIPIDGTLVAKAGSMDAESGLVSYEKLSQQIHGALDDTSVRGILLDVNSGGGEVRGNFDMVDSVYARRDEKPIWAVANEWAASGAYSIISLAQKIYLPRTGTVGSIGVISPHIDQSGFDENTGLKWTLIHAGAHKVDGNAHEPLNEAGRSWLQNRVNTMQDIFVNTVARNRGLSPELIRATEAQMYMGQEAVTQKLADVVGTFDQAFSDFNDFLNGAGPRTLPVKPSKETTMTTKDTTAAPEAPATADKNPAAETTTAPEAPPAAAANPVPTHDDGVRQERERAAAIITAGGKLKIPAAEVTKLISEGVSIEKAQQRMIDYRADNAPANGIVSVNSTATDSADNGLSLEEKCKKEWESSEAIRTEFVSLKTYTAFKRADAEGKITRVSKTA
jgi:capsid assembly protease